MREATEELEAILEYCKAILNAETEEEVFAIKQEVLDILRANGVNEQLISDYDHYLDSIVESFENGEICFDENGQLVRTEQTIQESVESTPLEAPNAESLSLTSAGVVLGLVASTIVVTLSVKKTMKKVLKKKKK